MKKIWMLTLNAVKYIFPHGQSAQPIDARTLGWWEKINKYSLKSQSLLKKTVTENNTDWKKDVTESIYKLSD